MFHLQLICCGSFALARDNSQLLECKHFISFIETRPSGARNSTVFIASWPGVVVGQRGRQSEAKETRGCVSYYPFPPLALFSPSAIPEPRFFLWFKQTITLTAATNRALDRRSTNPNPTETLYGNTLQRNSSTEGLGNLPEVTELMNETHAFINQKLLITMLQQIFMSHMDISSQILDSQIQRLIPTSAYLSSQPPLPEYHFYLLILFNDSSN